MDWRASGQFVRERWIEDRNRATSTIVGDIEGAAESLERYVASNVGFFRMALAGLARGAAPDALIEYLRSDRPMDSRQRELLADYFAGRFPRPVPKGRPADDDTHLVVGYAEWFYADWKEENRKREIRDHGHSGEMKEISVSTVIEVCDFPGVEQARALDLWSKSSQRRN